MHWTYNLNPTILKLGPFEIRWYGVMYVIGMLTSYILLKNVFARKGSLRLSENKIDDLITWVFFGMLIGARFFYVFIYNFADYMQTPAEIFAFWHGGLSFHGAVTGIVVATILFARKNKLSALNLGDHLVFCGAIGIFWGRIGNFINGELWGRASTVPWAIIFPSAGPYPRHPSQVYESLFEGLILAIILFFTLKKQKRDGTSLFTFFALYSIFRFFLEFFREPDAQLGLLIFNLSMGQILSAIMLLVTLVIWRYTIKKSKLS